MNNIFLVKEMQLDLLLSVLHDQLQLNLQTMSYHRSFEAFLGLLAPPILFLQLDGCVFKVHFQKAFY